MEDLFAASCQIKGSMGKGSVSATCDYEALLVSATCIDERELWDKGKVCLYR